MLKKTYKGLSDSQVVESRKKNGSNTFTQKEQDSFFKKLLDTLFGDPLIKILLVALVIQTVFFIFGLGESEWYEPVVIAIAIALATIVGTISEDSSEKQFQLLQEEASKIKCKVFRNGQLIEIFIGEIVVGDKVLLQTGDKIPADGIIVEGYLDVNQASLNGETKLAKKKVAPDGFDFSSAEFDEEDSPLLNPYKCYRDTVVSDGEAVLEVMFVGDNTLIGDANKKDEEEEEIESPLTVKLAKLAQGISKFGYIGGVAIAVALLIKHIFIAGGVSAFFGMGLSFVISNLVDAVIWAVIIIVMAVPEGLPMMISVVLSLNMKKLLKDQILVRKLIGIETAGSLNILFSDKTGTMTKGQLEVVNLYDGELKEYKNFDMPKPFKTIADASLRKNTSAVTEVDKETGKLHILGGNSTERALLQFAGVSKEEEITVIDRIAFNSTDKFSAAEIEGAGLKTTLLKGAPEKLIEKCKFYYTADGQKKPLTEEMIERINYKIDQLAGRAIRVLAFATVDNSIQDGKVSMEDACFVAITGIRDDLRTTTVEAIKEMQEAGVQVVMITGDRKETAVAIAKEAGLLTDKEHLAYTSKELSCLSDDELKAKLPNLRVVARALPQDKLRLVKIAQSLNLVVGMTGDGVNDCPALEQADVGFAMAKSGTESAKASAEINILDDDFKSIAKTCLYGRTIYKSIQKFIVFQLTVNVAAVAISFVGALLGQEPLQVTQILWVNLVMDTFAAMAFGGEPALLRYMEEKPKSRDESIVSKNMWSQILTGGIFIAILSFMFLNLSSFAGLFRADVDQKYLLTGYFTFFIFANVFNMFNARVSDTKLFDGITENKGFLKVVALIVVVQLIMTYLGGDALRCYGLTLSELAICTGLSFLVIPMDLIRKKILHTK